MQVSKHLFWVEKTKLGQDLKTRDIERGRDGGVPTYNDIRELCNFPRAQTFEDFLDLINMEVYECKISESAISYHYYTIKPTVS